MKKQRILKLADYLDTVPVKQFDMAMWGAANECGFAGCALGWAAHGKLFRGFKLEDGLCPVYFGTDGIRNYGYNAPSSLFDIPYEDAVSLFSSANDGMTPKQVATRLRLYVKRGHV